MRYEYIANTDSIQQEEMRYSDRILTFILEEMDAFCENLKQASGIPTAFGELRMVLDELRCGALEILFEGQYGVGKSSLINALLGREIIPTSFYPELSLPTKIQTGKQEKIEFAFQNGRTIVMPLERATWDTLRDMVIQDENRFGIIEEQNIYVNNGENRHGLFSFREANFCNAESWFDSQRSQAALAVVHLINATNPFTQADKEYIAEYYARKHMRNLFFVINRFDCVGENEVSALKETVRSQLSKVFTKQDGSFDEKLFRERVFYTSAYGSLMARTGKKIKVVGMEIAIDDNTTGVPEFEMALKDCVFQSPQIQRCLRPVLKYMCQLYHEATPIHESVYLKNARNHLNSIHLFLYGTPLTEKNIREAAYK